jgi:hypothetical protein
MGWTLYKYGKGMQKGTAQARLVEAQRKKPRNTSDD